MSRLVEETIDRVLTLGDSGVPFAFRWRGRSWAVAQVCEVWKDTGSWWEGEGEKTFFRLEVAGGRLMEVYRDHGSGKWFLYRVYD